MNRSEQRAIRSAIAKMRFAPGDIVVVRDQDTVNAIMSSSWKLPFLVPVILAPEGIQKISRAELKALIEQGEQNGDNKG